jgi:hypothetical protein
MRAKFYEEYALSIGEMKIKLALQIEQELLSEINKLAAEYEKNTV